MPTPAENEIQAISTPRLCTWPIFGPWLHWHPGWPAHLLFFPGSNPITSMRAATVSSHGLLAHITPQTSRGFRCLVPPGFLLCSLPTLFSDEKEVLSLEGTSGASMRAVQVGVSLHHCSLLPWSTRDHAGRSVSLVPIWGDPDKESGEYALASPLPLPWGM